MINNREKIAAWKVRLYLCFAVVLGFIFTGCFGCSPGRGGLRRRRDRKLTPLVYKQHVPNLPEHSLGASGPPLKRIRRDDPEFMNLLPNYNPDITFKDEEGTGADRLMTKRCKERADMLAISVMNQWPGIKLRVTEGWDEENEHAIHSLHYEGRALDITTSDRDSAKYGTLARLAIESGFDWVFYESRSHIHCSVKTESSLPSKLNGCFSEDSVLYTPSGEKTMKFLFPGDKVLTVAHNGTLIYSSVLIFLHRNQQTTTSFILIQTKSKLELKLTPWHVIFVCDSDDGNAEMYTVFAKDIKPGQFLRVFNLSCGEDVCMSEFSRISVVKNIIQQGVYAPLTSEGTIIVNRILASCYALTTRHWLSHTVFWPIRFYTNWKTLNGNTQLDKVMIPFPLNDNKIHWYANILYNVAYYLNCL